MIPRRITGPNNSTGGLAPGETNRKNCHKVVNHVANNSTGGLAPGETDTGTYHWWGVGYKQ